MQHELDEAEDTLGCVFAIPSLRNVSLSGRLARTRRSLAFPYWSGDPAAQHLNEALGEWLVRQS
jgi:hypothetical protein